MTAPYVKPTLRIDVRADHLDPLAKYPIVKRHPGPQLGAREVAVPAARATGKHGRARFVVLHDGMVPRCVECFDATTARWARQHIPDQIAGMRELARKHPYIDLAGGHLGHSAAVRHDTLFRFPDVFKVAVPIGNHATRER